MRSREEIMRESTSRSNWKTQALQLEVLLDIRDAVHAVRETGGKDGSN